MNKRIFCIMLLIVILVSSVFILTGCEKKGEYTYEELQKKSDVIIRECDNLHIKGGSKLKEYFINYSESKLYVCEIQTGGKDTEILKNEKFDVDSNKMKRLKEYIEERIQEMANTGWTDGASYSICKNGKSVGDISNPSQFEELIKEITGK